MKIDNFLPLKRFFEPFPMQNKGKKNLLTALYVSLFVSFFLYLFDPFNLYKLPMGAFYAAVCFGGVSFLCSVIYDFISNYVLRLKTDLPSWTLWRWLVYMLGLISIIAFGNIVLISIISVQTISGDVIWQMFKNTLMVGITPITAFGFQIQYQSNKTFQKAADEITLQKQHNTANKAFQQNGTITLQLSSSESLSLNLNAILYVESLQNYIQIHYQHADSGEIKTAVIRSTLSAFYQQLPDCHFFQCHRCFLVNLNHVVQVNGNAQGLKLLLTNDLPNFIPVSRRYISEFKQRFNTN